MIKIRVPATSANLGPGFDCLGIALGVYNTYEVSPSDTLQFEGVPENTAMKTTCLCRHTGKPGEKEISG